MDKLPKENLEKMRFNQEKSKQENRIKEIKQSLINIGFQEDGKYFRKDGDYIKIYEDDKLTDVFKRLISHGKTQKLWEIRNVLGVIS